MTEKSRLEFDFEALKAYLHGLECLEKEKLNADGEVLLADCLTLLADNRAVAFWENVFKSNEPIISEPMRYILRAAYRKRATLNSVKARTGDLFEEDAKGTLNISIELVPFNSIGQVYLEHRLSLEEKPFEPHPEKWAGMGVVVDHYETFEEAWVRVVKKFAGARIVQAVPVPLEGLFPRRVFDSDRGPFVLHVVAVLLDSVPANSRGLFFIREEMWKLDLVGSHREIILPAAFKWYDEVGFGEGSEVYDLEAMREKNNGGEL